MVLTPTAQRIMDTLPAYYWGNVIVQRIVQARANEIDRMDAMIDELEQGMIPTQATDTLGLLALWERILGLPVDPPDTVLAQRQAMVAVKLRALDATTGKSVLAMLSTITTAFDIQRDTPAPLQDELRIYLPSSSYVGAMLARVAERAWPAHRELSVVYETGGFVLDVSELDADAL